jgi:hypothetical protein
LTVVLLAAGEQGPTRAVPDERHAIVQFYDTPFMAAPTTTQANFVSACYLETLLPGDGGTTLAAGSPGWVIDPPTLNAIRAWLREANVWSRAQAEELQRLQTMLDANGGHGVDTITAIEALRSLSPSAALPEDS